MESPDKQPLEHTIKSMVLGGIISGVAFFGIQKVFKRVFRDDDDRD